MVTGIRQTSLVEPPAVIRLQTVRAMLKGNSETRAVTLAAQIVVVQGYRHETVLLGAAVWATVAAIRVIGQAPVLGTLGTAPGEHPIAEATRSVIEAWAVAQV